MWKINKMGLIFTSIPFKILIINQLLWSWRESNPRPMLESAKPSTCLSVHEFLAAPEQQSVLQGFCYLILGKAHNLTLQRPIVMMRPPY